MTASLIQQVRDFNRFYTNIIGLLDNHILNSHYSLPEARVLYELHHQQPCSATLILDTIGMDKGYLSRVLKKFDKGGLIKKQFDKSDGRATVISLTSKGEKEFAKINQASVDQLTDLLSSLNKTDEENLVAHMNEIKRIMTKNISNS